MLAWPSLSEEEGPPARSAPLAAQAEGRAARGSPLRAPATPPLTRLPPRAGLQAQAGLPSRTRDTRPPARLSPQRVRRAGAWPARPVGPPRSRVKHTASRALRAGGGAGRAPRALGERGSCWREDPLRSRSPEPAAGGEVSRPRALPPPGPELPALLPAALTPSPPAWPRRAGRARGVSVCASVRM